MLDLEVEFGFLLDLVRWFYSTQLQRIRTGFERGAENG